MSLTIGVLALQGAFIEHINVLKNMGIDTFEIRNEKDIDRKMDGIIIPGGESTVIGKLMKELNLFDKMSALIKNGMPVYGTCAGMILLAEKISCDSTKYLATIPITVKRNAYGRQLGSFYTEDYFNEKKIPMAYIRAPYIESVNDNEVKVLSLTDNKITAARYKNQLVTAFHPEVTNDTYVHEYFVEMIKNNKNI